MGRSLILVKRLQVALGPVGRRVASGVAANAVGKIWVALLQLLTIPVLATAWGADRFGLWLMITTVPSYIALTATGFNAVAGADIARSYTHGRLEDCRMTFQSVWALITTITGCLVLAGLGVRAVLALTGQPEFSLGSWEVGDAVALMLVYSFLAIQSGMVLAVYRGVGRYAQGTLLYDVIGLLEGLSLVALVFFLNVGMLTVALIMVFIRFAGMIWLRALIVRHEPWASFGVNGIRASEMRRLLHPSLGALTIAGGNSLAIQGVVLSLGLAVGPAATAAYASARTLARLPLQISDLLGRATVPEMSRAWFAPNYQLFWRLTFLNLGFALVVLVPYSLLMLLSGTDLARIVSRGNIEYEPWLLAALSLVVLIQGAGVALGQSIAAQVRQHSYGYAYLILASAMVTVPVFLAGTPEPATHIALSLALAEATALTLIVRALFRADYVRALSNKSF